MEIRVFYCTFLLLVNTCAVYINRLYTVIVNFMYIHIHIRFSCTCSNVIDTLLTISSGRTGSGRTGARYFVDVHQYVNDAANKYEVAMLPNILIWDPCDSNLHCPHCESDDKVKVSLRPTLECEKG